MTLLRPSESSLEGWFHFTSILQVLFVHFTMYSSPNRNSESMLRRLPEEIVQVARDRLLQREVSAGGLAWGEKIASNDLCFDF